KCHGKNLTSTTRAPERHDANVLKRAHQLAEQIESRNLAQRISTAEGHAQESQEQCNERLQREYHKNKSSRRTRHSHSRSTGTIISIYTFKCHRKSNLNNASSKGSRRKRVEIAQQLPEQIETRNAAQRIRTAESRARESQEQRDECLQQNITRTRVARERNIATVRALDRQRQRISRSLTRASFVRLAFEYAPDINYSAHSKIAIGGMDKVESERLRFLRFNQAKLRSEEYIHLRDAVAGNIDGNLNQ
ncbi:helitron_like_N domain-containing protein, partial [Trichonephila clavipes]